MELYCFEYQKRMNVGKREFGRKLRSESRSYEDKSCTEEMTVDWIYITAPEAKNGIDKI